MRARSHRRPRRILVIDIGGTHVKAAFPGQAAEIRIPSGPTMTPERMVRKLKRRLKGKRFGAVAMGYPGLVVHGRILREPPHLGKGWVTYDFERALGHPTRIINDAAMQALGSYEGGRMLFLGLGTGLGSAMIVDGELEPMELAHLPYKKGRTFEEYAGEAALKRLGRKQWQKEVFTIVRTLSSVLEPDYVVIGGGNLRKLKSLPPGARRGDNRNAFAGGERLWEDRRRL
ncbi:MAG: ROK family protein, partial [Thermoplasmata archaeon]|nr:ROK family protein [Thermoplasmata archaeon]